VIRRQEPAALAPGPVRIAEPDHAEQLLEDSWLKRGRRMRGAELRAEVVASLAFCLAALALWFAPGEEAVAGWVTFATVGGYAIASRVEFAVGAGYVVPTQLFLPVLLVVAAPATVPLLVLLGLALGTVGAWAAGRSWPDRLVTCGGDAWHAVGPALVFLAAGSPAPGEAPWWLFVAAFVAQLPLEIASTTLRERLAHGISTALQLRVMRTVWFVDAMLLPAGVVAAYAIPALPATPLLLLGFAVLLFSLARDRDVRIARAHARLAALQRERRRLRIAVQRIGEAFASTLDTEALLTITMRASVDALDADGGRASTSDGMRAAAHDESACGAALEAAERRAASTHEPAEAMVDGAWALARPIGRPDAPAGVVSIARRSSPFGREERELLDHLCEQASIAAGHAERHAALRRQAVTDELTGLANHRRLQELLGAAVARHERHEEPAGLILLDIDDFKAINDRHGHLTGDRVLKALGACLRSVCRATDEPARYGGEELAVVVHGDLAATTALAERLREAIELSEVVTPEGAPLRLTASCGVAALGTGIADAPGLIDAADAALYRAKAEGKNCVRANGVESPRLRAVG
jgi:diguanylate cyclase (GGDEF)-like protein